MRVLFGNVLIRPIAPETKTSSGIILPDLKEELVKKGTIVAIGTGSLALDGSPIPMEVQVGEDVLFKNVANKISLDGVEHYLTEQRDILMVLDKPKEVTTPEPQPTTEIPLPTPNEFLGLPNEPEAPKPESTKPYAGFKEETKATEAVEVAIQ